MGRLIDPGVLLDNLSGMLSSMEDYDAIRKVVNNMPTAYDVDAVVEQLEEWTFNADVNIGDGTMMNHNLIASKNAIEIVKAGGENDD